jgi:hypothetical protein
MDRLPVRAHRSGKVIGRGGGDMATILVVGGASLDLLHVAGELVQSARGAGAYPAMAARPRGHAS